jgi:hypothetical protein
MKSHLRAGDRHSASIESFRPNATTGGYSELTTINEGGTSMDLPQTDSEFAIARSEAMPETLAHSGII